MIPKAKGADGGNDLTGAGAKFAPAGIVHKGEFVHRQEVVRQPGALPFLAHFNRVGMAALADWQGVGLGQYAKGGLVMDRPARASSAANYQPAEPASASNVALQQRLLPVLDPDLISDALRGPAGEQLLVLHISRNPGKFRSLLKVGA